jgi:septal ring factor EnvC (AmiA/AmiB activator)
VAGRITRRYGETRRAGTGRKGITISARPHAQVIAPYDGIVAFAEKFRSYGRLLIIDHGEGYHTLLAGFARIDVAAGQGVLAGEPAGIMGLSRGGGTSLYFELRHKGKSINPIPWLVAQKIR